jgi:SAM-dependent methyltransferase
MAEDKKGARPSSGPAADGGAGATAGGGAGLALRNLVRRSPTLTGLGVRALGRLQALRDRRLSSGARWRRRAPDEARYWIDALQSPQARTRFADRLDPDAEISEPALMRALAEIDGGEVSILDVGSGPLTAVGGTYPGKRIEVVAIDPLADDYARILRDLRFDPPVYPVACSGEDIVEKFGKGSFDVSFALNALDHSVDPMLVVDNMVAAVAPAGRVALTHMRNEGERNGYFGIHFWNIDCRAGRFVIWNRDVEHDVGARLGGDFETECWTSEGDRVHCVIRRARPGA